MAKTRKKTGAPDEKWMTLPAAARALGEHRQTVLGRANDGEVETMKVAGYTFVSRASVERLLAERHAAA